MSEARPGARLEPRLEAWSAAESPLTVEYSLVAIEEIRQQVLEGFQRLARGGVEVGGALYGKHTGGTVTILAVRPIQCEHARGPGFALSDNDKSALEAQLRRDAGDPALEGMECVGWFLSHTRSEILLAEPEQEVYSDYFGAPWQVTLVVRPVRAGNMRAGFFVREADGSVKGDRSYLEFNFPDRFAGLLDRLPRSGAAGRTPPVITGHPQNEVATVTAPAPASQQIPAVPEPEPLPFAPHLLVPPARRRVKWPWLAVWGVAILVLAFLTFRYYSTPSGPDPIFLSVTEREGQLLIEWNPASKPVTSAVRGSLAIVDGKQTRTVPLSLVDLARGNFSYQRDTGDIEVRMTVESKSGEKVEEASRFLGSAPVKADADEIKTLQQQRDDLEAEAARLKQENAAQAERIRQLEVTLRILQTRLNAK